MSQDPRRAMAAAAAAGVSNNNGAVPVAPVSSSDTAVAPVGVTSSSSIATAEAAEEAAPAAPETASSSILFHKEDDEMDEDEDEDMILTGPAVESSNAVTTTAAALAASNDEATAAGGGGVLAAQVGLISRIMTPSPYQHHNSGPTSSRFRNALHRVSTQPTSDVEAWQALMTEVNTCYRTLMNSIQSGIVPLDGLDTMQKLDWAESCYGALLYHFPYASTHYVTIVEMLLAQSARPGEDAITPTATSLAFELTNTGNTAHLNHSPAVAKRALKCEQKLESIFRTVLGFNMDGTPAINNINNNTDTSTSISATNYDNNNDHTTTNGNVNGNKVAAKSSNKNKNLIGGMCVWCVELWMLYIQKAIRDARRKAALQFASAPGASAEEDRIQFARQATVQAYETALSQAAASPNNHILWKQYLAYVKSWVPAVPGVTDNSSTVDHALAQQQMLQLRSIYQRLVTHPMTGLDQLWQDYEQFERSQNEALAQALIQEFSPKYQHARTVYLERNRVYGGVAPSDLELGRLATQPVGYKHALLFGRKGTDTESGPGLGAGAGAGGGVGAGGAGGVSGTGTAGVPGAGGAAGDAGDDDEGEDHASKIQQEFKFMKVWKTRCSYERTNPERLNTQELAQRIRHAYKQMVSVLTRHPECWNMWATWELHAGCSEPLPPQAQSHTGSGAGAAASGSRPEWAMAVLRRAQSHIPDCTLLAYAEAQVVELYGINSHQKKDPSQCISVMERFLERSPNTLGFVLCQQMARRYKGMDEARKVFAKARRTLVDDHVAVRIAAEKQSSSAASGAARTAASKTATAGVGADDVEGADDGDAAKGDSAGNATAAGVAGGPKAETNRRWIVTNRLDPSIGNTNKLSNTLLTAGADGEKNNLLSSSSQRETINKGKMNLGGGHQIEKVGIVTWHLYASHAMIEHRLNKSPEIAARVYELGLRKHASFLTKPPYVMRYAQLLLELDDPTNLRALLTRAVAACEAQNKRTALGPLWDMTLRFESLLCADPGTSARLSDIERKRREAVLGPDVEDVATGGMMLSNADQVLIGAQKSSISEHLTRAEGYDVSSNIISGMGRNVDMLDVMGFWGSDVMGGSSSTAKVAAARRYFAKLDRADDDDDEISGGKSDALYQKRLRYEQDDGLPSDAGGGADAMGIGAGAAGTKILSARERLQQGAAAGGAGGPGQSSAMMLAIQQSPEWLRSLLLLLPASRLRLPIVAKPPPHLTELALSSLRQSSLPAERPADVSNGAFSTNKRTRGAAGGDGGNDSSDDENGGKWAGGYGSQFRNRQRARMGGGGSSSAEQNGGM